MSDPAIAQPTARKGVGLSVKDLAVVALLGAAVGAAFEATRPSAAKAEKPAEFGSRAAVRAVDPL